MTIQRNRRISIDFCIKCWSTSLIHKKIPSSKLKTQKFIDILQCSVCRHWNLFDKREPENKKELIFLTNINENDIRIGDKEEVSDNQIKDIKIPMDTQSFMIPELFRMRNFKLILKNFKIHTEKIIIENIKKKA